MSRQAKRRVVISVVWCGLLASGLGLGVWVRSLGAAAQALPDVGPFRAGSALGEERAGFSGRPQGKVFASASAPEWPGVAAALQDAEVARAMAVFTGVLVDEAAEPEIELVLRERDGMRVVVRSLEGAFLGGLKEINAADLAALLQVIAARLGKPSEPSPLCARLLESTEPIDALLAAGQRAEAEKLAEFLKEVGGADSPAVRAVEAKLGR